MACLRQNARDFPDRTFVVDEHHTLTYSEALEQTLSAVERFRRLKLQKAFFYGPNSAAIIVGLLAADGIGAGSCVLNYWHSEVSRDLLIGDLGPGQLFTTQPDRPSWASTEHDIARLLEKESDCDRRLPSEPSSLNHGNGNLVRNGSEVIILSSGTTGRPKAALYTWPRLLNQVRHVDRNEHHVWLLTYEQGHFAGIQMLLHVLANGHTLVIPPSRRFDDILTAIKKHGVDAISGTPTFWRFFAGRLSRTGHKATPLRQITLGGEIITEALLTMLKELFPTAGITQVYATTELGSCFAVRDGRPGFPVEFLKRRAGNVDLKIVDGELYCRAANKMIDYVGSVNATDESGWIATGDLVEIQGDRVMFRGRKSESINVGGVKVSPAKVEGVILQEKDVLAVRVYGKPNPITGQLVAAEMEIAPGANCEELLRELRTTCNAELTKYERPREFRIVNRITRRNGKIVRTGH